MNRSPPAGRGQGEQRAADSRRVAPRGTPARPGRRAVPPVQTAGAAEGGQGRQPEPPAPALDRPGACQQDRHHDRGPRPEGLARGVPRRRWLDHGGNPQDGHRHQPHGRLPGLPRDQQADRDRRRRRARGRTPRRAPPACPANGPTPRPGPRSRAGRSAQCACCIRRQQVLSRGRPVARVGDVSEIVVVQRERTELVGHQPCRRGEDQDRQPPDCPRTHRSSRPWGPGRNGSAFVAGRSITAGTSECESRDVSPSTSRYRAKPLVRMKKHFRGPCRYRPARGEWRRLIRRFSDREFTPMRIIPMRRKTGQGIGLLVVLFLTGAAVRGGGAGRRRPPAMMPPWAGPRSSGGTTGGRGGTTVTVSDASALVAQAAEHARP